MEDEYTVTEGLACAMRNYIISHYEPQADPDKLYDAIHYALVENFDEVVKISALPIMREAVLKMLKEEMGDAI